MLYDGGYDGFSLNGYYNTENEVHYKHNPLIESEMRLNMAYLLLTNPQMMDVIKQTGAVFFHGTNANALPSILKYGINSVNKLQEKNIEVTTGEEWSRIQGKRSFVSITDSLSVALSYANKKNVNSLLNFGVVIGSSLRDMSEVRTTGIFSDFPEVGIKDTLPLDKIKFLAVPPDKEEFVKKLIGTQNITVLQMDLNDQFYFSNFPEKLQMLEQNHITKENNSMLFSKEDVKKVVQARRSSKISNIFQLFKNKIHDRLSQNTKERG